MKKRFSEEQIVALLRELASIDLTTGEDRGLLRMRGQVLSGYMIGLKVQTRLTATGEWADYLEGPDFDTPNAMMPHSSAFGDSYIAEGGMGHRFEITLDVRGMHSLRIMAVAEETPASETVVQITDASF
jgi:hypothetical protein